MFEKVEIKRGPHSTEIPKRMPKLFEDFFRLVNFDRDDYSLAVLLGEQIRGSGHCRPLQVKRIDPKRGSVVVAVKSGDNGTRFNCFLFRPKGYTGTEKDFFDSLKEAENKFNNIDSKEGGAEIKMQGKKTEFAHPIQDKAKVRAARRIVSKILDEEAIKFILLEVSGASGGQILQHKLKKKIIDAGIKCSESQAIKFLKNEGYVNEEVINRIKRYISLGEKGLKLLDNKEAQPEKAPTQVSAQAETNKQTKEFSELILLSKKFEEAEKQILVAEEKVQEITGQLQQACKERDEANNKKLEIKQAILGLLK